MRTVRRILLAAALATGPSWAIASPIPITFAERELFESPGDNMISGNLDASPLPELVGVRDGDVLIRRNLGGRAFAEAIVVPMSVDPIAGPVLADLNGDGRLDLVAWSASPPALYVRLNQGGLTFSPTATVALPKAPTGLCAGDLNGDLRSDLVVMHPNGFTAYIAGPGGALSAGPPQSIESGGLYSPQIADLNGDGRGDLALYVERYVDQAIEWFAGNGDGGFGSADTAVTRSSGAFVLADLDRDGEIDVVQSDTGWNRNDGAGHFTATVRVSPDIPCNVYSLAVADLDQDGAQDIVLAGQCGGSAQQNNLMFVVYAALDDATRHVARWHVPRYPIGAEVADFDGDGQLDVATHCYTGGDYLLALDAKDDRPLVAGGFFDGPTAILWSTGDGALAGKLDIPLGIPSDGPSGWTYAPNNLLTLHNGPGTGPDLLAGARDDMRLLRNRGRGDFFAPDSVGRGKPRAAVDLNGDDFEDLIASTSDSIWVRLRTAPSGGFGAAALVETAMPLIGVADFDGDGAPDLALEDTAHVVWMRPGDGAGGFGGLRNLIGTLPADHGGVLLDDLNRDGRADLATAEGEPIEVRTSSGRTYKAVLHVLLNDGSGALTSDVTDTLTAYDYFEFNRHNTIASGDLDGDGDRDIVLQKNSSSNGSWFGTFVNDGAGGFDVTGPAATSGNPGGLVVCRDLNGDGLADVLFHDSDGYDLDFRIAEAVGGGQCGELQYHVGVNSATGMVAADFNSDGMPDVALLDGYEGRVAILLNTTPFGATPTQLALASAQVVDDAIQLEWQAPGPESFSAQLERNNGADWHPLTTLTSDGLGQVRYRDADVTRGTRYGYRLRYHDGARELLTAESWVAMPTLAFALRPPSPSPVRGVPAFGVSLPARGDAALEILDIAGRRVREQRLSSLAPGDHRVTLEGAPLAPGLYFARLRLASASARTKFVVIR